MTRTLTAADKLIDILYFPDGGVIAVADKRLHSIQQAVDVDDGTRVLELGLELTQPPLPVLVLDRRHPDAA